MHPSAPPPPPPHAQAYHPHSHPAYGADEYGAPPGGRSGGAGDGASERYTRLLERDIETLREELRAAREKADDPQVMRELRDAQDALRHEKQKVADLQRQVEVGETTAAQLAHVQEECDKLRHECRQHQLDMTHMQRDLAHAQDAAASSQAREERLRSEIEHLKEDIQSRDHRLSEVQHELAQMKRQSERDREASGLEHSREVSSLQLEVSSLQQKVASREHELKSRDHTISTLQQQLKKEVERSRESSGEYEKTLTQLREARDELQRTLRATVQDNEAKEAALKCLGTGWADGAGFREVEVVRQSSGDTELTLHGAAAERAAARGILRWHVSLTHTETTATAFVVAEA